jgi:hypothetical protein
MGGQGQSGSSTEDEDFNEDLWDFLYNRFDVIYRFFKSKFKLF